MISTRGAEFSTELFILPFALLRKVHQLASGPVPSIPCHVIQQFAPIFQRGIATDSGRRPFQGDAPASQRIAALATAQTANSPIRSVPVTVERKVMQPERFPSTRARSPRAVSEAPPARNHESH